MKDKNVSYETSDEDWAAWREEEEYRDALYEAQHQSDDSNDCE